MDEENKLGTPEELITEPTENKTTEEVVTPTIEELQKQVDEYKIKTTIPETYDLSKIESLQETDVTVFSEFAKKTNLTQDQAVEVASEYTKMMQDQQSQVESFKVQMKEDALKSLTEVFGDNTEAKLAGAKKIVKDFGGEQLSDYLDQTGLGNNVDLIQAFVKISDSLGEDANATTSVNQKSSGNVTTPEDAKRQLKEIFSTKKGRDNVYNALDPNATNDFKKIKELAQLAATKK